MFDELKNLQAYINVTKMLFKKAFGKNVPEPEKTDVKGELIYRNNNFLIRMFFYDIVFAGFENDPLNRSCFIGFPRRKDELWMKINITIDNYRYYDDIVYNDCDCDSDFYYTVKKMMEELFKGHENN